MDKAKAEALYRRGLRATVAKLLAFWREITRLRKRAAKLDSLVKSPPLTDRFGPRGGPRGLGAQARRAG